MKLIDFALDHSRTFIAILFFLIIAGTTTYINIPKEAAPDVNIPYIYVSLSDRGISPEDSERLLIKPIEDEVKTVEGLKEMRSTAYSGGGNVLLEFDAGFDADKAIEDIREKVDRAKGDLPENADDPTVNEVNISAFPILLISISGNVDERTLQKLADKLQDSIEGIPSVLEAKINGKIEEQVDVVINVRSLEGYNLRLEEVINIVNQNNKMISAGSQDTGDGSFEIKVPGLYEELKDVLETPIKTQGDSVIRFKDIASVNKTFEDRSNYARVGGIPAITIEVSKRVGENLIDTVNEVKTAVLNEKKSFPKNIKISFSQDQSNMIKDMVNNLENSVIAAVILVMIIILGVLGIRSGFLVGVSIPGSFLTGILSLYLFGFTINFVVLFALILAVGLLVDGAIVVVEYADRKINEGLSVSESFKLASIRMALPIIASTLTTLAAFAPLVFWPGLAGEFMKYLPITLLCVLSASLFMALLFVPVLGASLGTFSKVAFLVFVPITSGIIIYNLLPIILNLLPIAGFLIKIIHPLFTLAIIIVIFRFFKLFSLSNKIKIYMNKRTDNVSEVAKALSAESNVNPTDLPGFIGIYSNVVNFLLVHPAKVIIFAILLLITIIFSYGKFGNGVEFFPQVEPELSKLVIYGRGNLSVDEKNSLVSEVEDIVLKLQENKKEFKTIYTSSGNVSDQSEDAEDIIGSVTMEYNDWDKRRPSKAILKEIIDETKNIYGIKVESREQEEGPPGGKPINIELTSYNYEILKYETQRLTNYLNETSGVINVENTLPMPGIEWELEIDRAQASKFNADITSVGNVIKLVTNGIKLGEFRPDDSVESVPIYLRYETNTRTLDMLENIRVPTNNGLVPISNIVKINPKKRTGNIIRVDSKRTLNVKADVDIGILSDNKIKELEFALGLSDSINQRGRPISLDKVKKINLDPSVNVKFKGEIADQKEAQAFLQKAFMIALFIMAMILVTQFNSFYSAFLILFSVIMSIAGVFIGLIITGQVFGIVMTGVGVIALAGIVVNNNIILIDTFDHLKKVVSNKRMAIVKTGAQRLRPVLLTTVTTILGLMPMTLMINIDFFTREIKYGSPDTQWWVQMSTAIVFGLLFATLLTLIVTPCALMLRENVVKWLQNNNSEN
tara:strand:+ start:3110 stop:6508 length:3399 start_codon:yes stop_codon:yes gene_type:complete